MDRRAVARWVEAYERAWRRPGSDHLGELFTPDVSYTPSPWEPAVKGLDQLGQFWEAEREGPEESFVLASEIVALERNTAVVRVSVEYLDTQMESWRDLWIIRFAADGRCTSFEEWPFLRGQGHSSPQPE